MTATKTARARLEIPRSDSAIVQAGRHTVRLTNLDKVFWPELGLTKRDLLQYYVDVSPVLLPHLRDRAMVMKRYPNGIHGKFFFMKRTPSPRPEWLETCEIMHKSQNLIAFPMVQDLASLSLGGQPGVHRPQPVVCPLRRRGSPRLPSLRSRSRRGRRIRPSAEDVSDRARRAPLVAHDAGGQD